MEKSIVLYEKGNNFEKAYVQTLAGEWVVVSKVMVEGKYFEIMVFATDGHGRVINYEPLDEYTILNPVIAEYGFNDAIEAYVEDDNPGIDVVDVDIYDRTFKDNGQDWASYLVRDSNGNLGVGGINVEYVSNWYIRNA